MTTQELWQSQALDAPRISPAFARHQASEAARRAHWRNAQEYLTTALCVGLAVWFFLSAKLSPLMQAGVILVVPSSLIYAWCWRRLSSMSDGPADMGVLDSLRFHRRQLERQRDAWRGNWRWSVPLFLPSIVLIFAATLMDPQPRARDSAVFQAIWTLVGVGIAIYVCERRASRLQREIDALDSLTAS